MKPCALILVVLLLLTGCGSNVETADEIPVTRTPITSASQLKVHIDDIPFLLDGLRDLGLDCGKFDQIDAWKKEKHEFALCNYKDTEVSIWRWYFDEDAELEINSGSFQPWCQPYVTSNNWAITAWDASVIRDFATFLETDAREDKNSANANDCLL